MALASAPDGRHARSMPPPRRTPRRLVLAAVLLSAGAGLALYWHAGRISGPLLFTGGSIVTVDAGDRVVEALAVDDGRVVAAGARSELQPWAQQHSARVVDLH